MALRALEVLAVKREKEARIAAFLLLLSSGSRGRYSASSLLGLGQGVLRGLYRELSEQGLIKVARGGARITPEGRARLQETLARYGVISAKALEEVEAWGAKYRGVAAALARSAVNVVEARDAAVRCGPTIALVVKRSDRGFYLPLVEEVDLRSEAPQIYSALEELPKAEYYLVVLGDKLYPCVKGLLNAAAPAQ